jgi:hypothetical protein
MPIFNAANGPMPKSPTAIVTMMSSAIVKVMTRYLTMNGGVFFTAVPPRAA